MYGVTSTELKRFSSYLRGRKQFVKFHQETSEFCDITCGVPQGSILGPVLFLLFINDFSNFTVWGCVLNMYADDIIIYTSATSKDELKYRFQVCIDYISNGIIWTSYVLIRRKLMSWLLEQMTIKIIDSRWFHNLCRFRETTSSQTSQIFGPVGKKRSMLGRSYSRIM